MKARLTEGSPAVLPPAPPPFVPVWEPPAHAARRVGLSRSGMYLLMAAGSVTWRQLGGRRLVNIASLLAHIESLPGRDAG